MRKTSECIKLYTLEEAEKIISYRNKNIIRKKYHAIKQKILFKGISFVCFVFNLVALFTVEFDNGGALVGILIGLLGLLISSNVEITC